MNIIKYKSVFLGFSALLIAASIYGIIAFNLKLSIDFTGGTLWQIQFNGNEAAEITRDQIADFLKEKGVDEVIVTEQGTAGAFIIKTKEMTEASHGQYGAALRVEFGNFTELSFESIGSVVGGELTRKALWAFVITLVTISLYVAYAFRKVSYPVSSWKYAVITLATLFHDGLIPVGLFAFLGHYAGVEIDTNFILAILVVIGFSVHDTIVVFDRIRESLRTSKSSEDFGELVNRSVNETFARSVNTSLTLIIVLAVLYILGAVALKWFVLAMLVGTIAGTYSSIFVASPLLVLWQKGRKQ